MQAFFHHYKTEFSKRKIDKVFSVNKVLLPLISQENNISLTREITEQEVENALL